MLALNFIIELCKEAVDLGCHSPLIYVIFQQNNDYHSNDNVEILLSGHSITE